METTIPVKWFASYMTHVVNNIVNRDGEVRFSYQQMRTSLDALEQGREDIDEEVRKLMINIIGVLPPIELTQRQEVTLCLALLNAHMAYHLINPELAEFIDAVRRSR